MSEPRKQSPRLPPRDLESAQFESLPREWPAPHSRDFSPSSGHPRAVQDGLLKLQAEMLRPALPLGEARTNDASERTASPNVTLSRLSCIMKLLIRCRAARARSTSTSDPGLYAPMRTRSS